jgi:diguanylate cyclase
VNVYFDSIEISTPLALAIMATLGYVFGTLRQRRKCGGNEVLFRLQRDLSRATTAVKELEKVIGTVTRSTAKHYSRLKKFQGRMAKLSSVQEDAIWHELCREVEGILDPTLQLVSEIANAQERIRYQSNYLMTFSEVRTDPLTGLGNRRAMDHVLHTQRCILARYGTPFSLAILDVDDFKILNDENGHQHGDQVLCDLAKLLQSALRSIDVLARYGGDEFVIVMPHTDIAGAELLAERLRGEIERQMPFTASVGVASANDADTPESLFKRADTALYHAKNGGRNRVFCNHGEISDAALREVTTSAAVATRGDDTAVIPGNQDHQSGQVPRNCPPCDAPGIVGAPTAPAPACRGDW